MKKNLMKRIISLLILFLLPSISFSNGWTTESPFIKSGDLKLDTRIKIKREKVVLILNDDSFSTTVEYHLLAKDNSYKGYLSFPILCKNTEYGTEKRQCVEEFSVSVDGMPMETKRGTLDELIEFELLYKINVYDQTIIDKHFNKEGLLGYSVPEDGSNVIIYGSNVIIYRTKINSKSKKFKVKIEYTTPYNYNFSGVTKRSFYYYSNDIVYYDFSPAAEWSKDELDKLSIIVIPKDIKGDIKFPDNFTFKKSNNKFVASFKNVKLADVNRLIIGVEQREYKQYKSHIRNMDYATDKIYLSSNDTLRSKKNAYVPLKATDKKTKTAWCSNKTQPKFQLNVMVNKKQGIAGCYLEGIGFLNGYTKSRKILKANRRVKKLLVTLEGITTEHHFEDPAYMKQFFPFRAIRHLEFSQIKNDNDFKIDFRIVETYPGTKYNDVCISEIYPVFNCP